ncbi:restriction endonuclease subunit S [Aquiflexum gelatinilyticum]|uniref:restriction endonuclease subunit S n=1 Tax=Aquiflexum gelatinilyticum TaxID=2961943 RepID=UPI0021697C0B|nr:restriction endonuclease subunit S [Aquiflexum gelatinilyticum]MCS4436181.1 restriction endonuclease subunit S [Aquiflexum gelatinilyticum]
MKSNYKPLGKFIRLVDERNRELEDLPLMGLSVSKVFFPTIANLVGTDMSTYKIVYKNQFTYIADTSRRGDKIAIALNEKYDKMLVSQAYTPFEVSDSNELDPEYLMMWFRRPEFDRYARFKSHGSAREIFDWEEMCNTLLPIPSITKQREIVKEYNVIQNRIALNQQLIQKLEETAQAIYREWFVEGIDMENLPEGWNIRSVYETTNFINGAPFKESDFDIKKAGLPIIKIAELKNGIGGQTDFTLKQLVDKYKITNGDMLYSWSGNPETSLEVFKWFGGDALLNQHIFKLEFEKQHSKFFVYYLLKELKREFVRLAEGKQTTGLGHVTIADLKELTIPYPSKQDLKKFENIIIPFYEYDSILIKENQKLTELKELLLSRLATAE